MRETVFGRKAPGAKAVADATMAARRMVLSIARVILREESRQGSIRCPTQTLKESWLKAQIQRPFSQPANRFYDKSNGYVTISCRGGPFRSRGGQKTFGELETFGDWICQPSTKRSNTSPIGESPDRKIAPRGVLASLIPYTSAQGRCRASFRWGAGRASTSRHPW